MGESGLDCCISVCRQSTCRFRRRLAAYWGEVPYTQFEVRNLFLGPLRLISTIGFKIGFAEVLFFDPIQSMRQTAAIGLYSPGTLVDCIVDLGSLGQFVMLRDNGTVPVASWDHCPCRGASTASVTTLISWKSP